MAKRKQTAADGGVPSQATQPAAVLDSRGTVLVVDNDACGLDSGESPFNALLASGVEAYPVRSSSAGGLDGGVIGGKTRGRKRDKYDGGGPEGNRGGTPKCGSLHDKRRASASAIPPPESNNTDFPRNTLLPKVNIPHISSQYVPPSDKNTHINGKDIPPPPENTPISPEGVLPQIEDTPPEYPPPGTALMQPRLGNRLGRDINGKIIPHERDEKIAHQIAEWVAIGAGENEIAQFLQVRPGVLRKHYKYELDNGKFANDMQVGSTILSMAKSGASERMALFYAKARMGWRESDSNDTNNAALLNIHIHT